RDRDPALMFWVFAVVSAARTNAPAMQRAIASLREIDGENRLKDAGLIRGAALPEAAALEAVHAGKTAVVERQLGRLLKFHAWETRLGDALDRAVDFRTLGVARFAASKGLRLRALQPPLPPIF